MKKVETVTKSDPYTEMVTYTGTVAELAALAYYARYYADVRSGSCWRGHAAIRLSRKINIELPADFYLNQDKLGI